MVDRSLNWDEHINNLRTKVSRAMGFLKYSRKFLPQIRLVKCIGVSSGPVFGSAIRHGGAVG